jgi:fucose 4-O-acetylase-like acetyltransferase
MAVESRAHRDMRIDALKGVAILCVVLYHTMGQYLKVAPELSLYVREFLMSFQLSLFAFLSGYVLGRPGAFRPREYFTRRTLGLMVPYLCWEIVYALVLVPSLRNQPLKLLPYLGQTLLNPHFEGRMWYLYVLWIALMILGVARLWGDRTGVILASFVLVVAIPWLGNFQRLQWLYEFVVFGLLARRFEAAIMPRLKTLGIVGAVSFVGFWLLSHPQQYAVARAVGVLGKTPLAPATDRLVYTASTLAGLAATAALFWAATVVPDAWLHGLAAPGRLSMGIYVSHFFFVEMFGTPPLWLIPFIVAFATVCAAGVTLVLGDWRVTATLLLGEKWVHKPRKLGDIETETL